MEQPSRSPQPLISALVVAVQQHKPSPEEVRYAFTPETRDRYLQLFECGAHKQ